MTILKLIFNFYLNCIVVILNCFAGLQFTLTDGTQLIILKNTIRKSRNTVRLIDKKLVFMYFDIDIKEYFLYKKKKINNFNNLPIYLTNI